MNLLLILPGFILAFIIVLYYERKVRNLSSKTKNNVHFYVARDKNGTLWLYMGKPYRDEDEFKGFMCIHSNCFEDFNLDKNYYANLKWEDEPVEVFINMEE